ncbi:helix-turn-helix transcriptional regulator [Bdellovibrio bacteriovorus]|uniref:helix-turn-helix transcriptional regulator n=1 Tax=Bdellovibrio bacteriovorus TaxID=959 RepID=UPI003AA8D7FB
MKQHPDEFQAYFKTHFDKWGLTKTECEVGGLILLGLSLREIADRRGTSETTTRQQALSLYKKASVEGRHQLAAYFLEILLAAQTSVKPFVQSGSGSL